jgi:hypothetical protein
VDQDSIRVDGHGAATITDIQAEVVPRNESFSDAYPSDEEEHSEDSTISDDSDDDHEIDKSPVDAAEESVRQAELELAQAQNQNATALKLLEFLDQYGRSMQAKEVDVAKMNDYLNVYREQRTTESERHQKSTAEIRRLEKSVLQAQKKFALIEKKYTKARDAASRDVRRQREKKARERQQRRQQKKRIAAERRKFWTDNVSKVVVHLDWLSGLTPGSSRRSSIMTTTEKGTEPGSYTATSTEADTATLRLTYVVPRATWAPRYELSINTPTSSAKLVYRAEFENVSTETWQNTKIMLSTSQTSFSGLEEKIPTLQPWHVKLGHATESDAENEVWTSVLESKTEAHAKSKILNKTKVMSNGNRNTYQVMHHPNHASNFLAGKSSHTAAPFTSANVQQMQQQPPPPPPAAPAAGLFADIRASGFGSGLFGNHLVTQDEADEESDPGEETDGLTLAGADNALGHQESIRQDYGLTTTYDLPGQRTLAPSSVRRRHVIAELDLKSMTLSHVLVPKLRVAAFLKARITNTSSVALLRGKAGMTVDGTFLGSTTLPNCGPDNFLDLSLGVDPSILVTYAKPTVRRATSGFFNKEDSAIFTRTCWIKNTKKTPVSITVMDQVPVSEDERLRVDILEPRGLGKEGDQTKLDELMKRGEKGRGNVYLGKNGQVKWQMTLERGKDVKLVLEYQSRIPSGQKFVGLD